MRSFTSEERRHPWRAQRDALTRAVGGSLLFSAPLLFTMEMWWIGESMHPYQLAAFVIGAFLANVGLARMSGFRPGHQNLGGDVAQACEAVAVGIVVSVLVLLALGRIGPEHATGAILGSVALQVVPLSLGAMVANVLFDPKVGRAGDDGASNDRGSWRELGNDVVATAAGAIFLGFAIAPTEEVPMLAAALGLREQLALVVLALVASYVIVFASGFDPAHREREEGGLFQNPFSETMLAYVVSLACVLLLLLGFGQVAIGDPAQSVLAQALVLAVPASIGGAAGRVVV